MCQLRSGGNYGGAGAGYTTDTVYPGKMHALCIGSTFGTDDVATRGPSLLPDIFAWGMFGAVMAVFLCNTEYVCRDVY